MHDLMQRVTTLEAHRENSEKTIEEIKGDLTWIRNKLSHYRPSWSVTVLVTFLTSLSVGLVVKLLG